MQVLLSYGDFLYSIAGASGGDGVDSGAEFYAVDVEDLTQAAADFCKNIGLSSIYSEVSAEGAARYLFWQPRGMPHEVRTGRTLEQFKAFDQVNIGRGWALLSLHVNEEGIYSAVWVPPDGFDTGKKVLEVYGITPGERRTGGTS